MTSLGLEKKLQARRADERLGVELSEEVVAPAPRQSAVRVLPAAHPPRAVLVDEGLYREPRALGAGAESAQVVQETCALRRGRIALRTGCLGHRDREDRDHKKAARGAREGQCAPESRRSNPIHDQRTCKVRTPCAPAHA